VAPETRVMKRAPFIAGLSLVFVPATAQAAPSDFGIVLMHGKWSSPNAFADVAMKLRAVGYRVEVPEMPWSGRRLYDVDFPTALQEVDAVVGRLKAAGANRIVVGGHSYGCPASVSYAATRGNVAGVIALGPPPFGVPGNLAGSASYDEARQALAEAQQMVNDGKGDDIKTWIDINQGRSRMLPVKAHIYVTYHDREYTIPTMAPKMKPGTPLLMVVGENDPIAPRAKALFFDVAPPDPRSSYVIVPSAHSDTPNVSLQPMLEWLKTIDA